MENYIAFIDDLC